MGCNFDSAVLKNVVSPSLQTCFLFATLLICSRYQQYIQCWGLIVCIDRTNFLFFFLLHYYIFISFDANSDFLHSEQNQWNISLRPCLSLGFSDSFWYWWITSWWYRSFLASAWTSQSRIPVLWSRTETQAVATQQPHNEATLAADAFSTGFGLGLLFTGEDFLMIRGELMEY